MTAEQLRDLEASLWESADQLRANSKLTATEYSFPVLGLIFLRHAYRRFKIAKEEIEKNLPVHPQRGKRPLTKEDFLEVRALYLPENAQWKYIAELPEGKDLGATLDEAMKTIEDEYEVLQGVLPRNYTLFENDLLKQVVRIFNREALDHIPGDAFGRIYEYFLNKFAMSGAQEGGEFFTPPSLVNAIVNIIEPDHGIVFDPACGSAGMFVQTGHFIEEEGLDPANKVTFYGQEKADTNTRLAKMNMAVHGLDANILQGNTFYEDQHELVGKCDFVMANPPFNVDGVDKSKESVKNDARIPFALPKNDNANYLWIQYFYSYLNDTGRAGFVMASSASDAGHSEKLIREELVKTGCVDVMVAIGTKFFYTRSLPCTLWFLNKAKAKDPERSQQTLMLDLRDVYRKVSSNLHDFTPEHLRNVKAIVGLYRGNTAEFEGTIAHYEQERMRGLQNAQKAWEELQSKAEFPEGLEIALARIPQQLKLEELKKHRRTLNNSVKEISTEAKELLRSEELKKDKKRKENLQNHLKEVESILQTFNESSDHGIYFDKEYHWLSFRFPEGTYQDISGLCKIAYQEEIAANDYSLTPGRYVGVAPQVEDEDFDFEERMGEIKLELQGLNDEAVLLANTIQANLNELGL